MHPYLWMLAFCGGGTTPLGTWLHRLSGFCRVPWSLLCFSLHNNFYWAHSVSGLRVHADPPIFLPCVPSGAREHGLVHIWRYSSFRKIMSWMRNPKLHEIPNYHDGNPSRQRGDKIKMGRSLVGFLRSLVFCHTEELSASRMETQSKLICDLAHKWVQFSRTSGVKWWNLQPYQWESITSAIQKATEGWEGRTARRPERMLHRICSRLFLGLLSPHHVMLAG